MPMLACCLTLLLFKNLGEPQFFRPRPPELMKFQGGRIAAFSMEFDDSMDSQVRNVLPLLKAKGLTATFFINPGAGHYAKNRETWEHKITSQGHEVGNHTWSHKGAETAATADQEISKAQKVINTIYGGTVRLSSFTTPGGVPWKPNKSELDTIFHKNLLVSTRARDMNIDGQAPNNILSFVEKAVSQKGWVELCIHGVGDEWLTTSVPNLTKLMDSLNAHKSQIWVAPKINVLKYQMERDAVTEIKAIWLNENGFDLKLDCDPKIAKPYGQKFAQIFDEPLTLKIKVPPAWKKFSLNQGGKPVTIDVSTSGADKFAMIQVFPNAGPAKVRRVDRVVD